ncbi:Bacterio-opsin activator HTH domain protein (plasmid) [Haloterrigena turkmenica DSM 5511]|uniref:Bacterio-opsin activator HTH domain protein n=1 Tax=Haloterrigena turkmenica (strain ATCC 51198 / DSM 5511 / JCM 9101 / NCIMB 13204 / VKM B-1734 / 4k) TaxID=543526 RepID=D2S0I7_HALTV|nr:helix-turn-helix domain-containing protein [Haloterrigena turkmenica]ADB62884.1 Bacterio-opsin activator HTH domain protein [Haloterrigena turkmenica DSM 5511]
MYKAVFRIKSDSPYASSTAQNNTRIELWCNDHCDLLHIAGDQQADVVEHVRSGVGVRECIENGSNQTIITEACLKEYGDDYIEAHLAANDCLLLPPLRYEHGAKVVRVLALDPANLSMLYSDISAEHEVTVESKQELATVRSETPVLSVSTFLPNLSDRQRNVFLTAFEQGYYEIPRGTTTSEIAEIVGVGRRTVEHHLRRAEEKFANAFAEYL